MATCVKLKRKKTRVCIGSLNKKIVVNTRSIEPPSSGSVDFTEEFTEPQTVWSMIETVDGKTIFDDTNTEQIVTHRVYIRYILGVTPEKWLKILSVNNEPDVYLNILKVENYGENNDFYRIWCNFRGNDSLPVNEA